MMDRDNEEKSVISVQQLDHVPSTGPTGAKQTKVASVALTDAVARDNPRYTDKSQLLLYGIVLFATLSTVTTPSN